VSSVFVVDACRTPIGKVKGSLAEVRPDHLAAGILKALLDRNPAVDPAAIDDVYWGAANQAGEDNRNVARMAVLLAGLPVEVPGATVNRLCGSGMEAVADAARAIAAGDADICVAGGTESMTRAPFVIARTADPYPRSLDLADTRLGWRLVSPKMQEMYPPVTLGETAENVADKYGITRERQDEWALRSHHRAAAARDAGRFGSEVVPVTTSKGEVTSDEGIKADITLEELAAKKPAFRKGGTVTGGNSSPLNDGGAALLLMSEEAVDRAGLTPIARYAGAAAAGVHPDYMGIGPVPAVNRAPARLLRRADRHHAAARDAPPRGGAGRRRDVHRRRPGHRNPLGSSMTAVLTSFAIR
jgi:acetyl-CoA acetyltransferase family protein